MKLSTSSPAHFLFVAVLLVLLLVAPPSDAATSCGTVLSYMSPCLTYLRSGSGRPPASCCSGVKKLAAAATTTPDRRTACGCLKQAAKTFNVQAGLAQSLPRNCWVKLPYTISPSTDCTKVT